MNRRSFQQHLDPQVKPKRILSLDGGGLRGVMTVAFLQRIENILREREGGDADFRLSDYYDLIGGTSTGSIIAAGLALGMSVAEIRGHYFELGSAVFKPSIFRHGVFVQQYDAGAVAAALKGVFGERTLGSSDFKTGLLVMTKRLDTGSAWPLTNNPRARYFAARQGSTTVPNRDYPLWSVVRASTAAPTYFEPEIIEIKAAAEPGGARVVGEFVDGGVSTANNPALQLVLAATVTGYGFGWEMGEDKLAVTSVGTGRANPEIGLSTGADSLAALHAVRALKSVLDDCGDLVEVVMQWMSHSPTSRSIDLEMGTLQGCHPGAGPCLTYLRYNVHFDDAWCSANLDAALLGELQLDKTRLAELALMDVPENMEALERIGKSAAERLVQKQHFAAP